MKNWIFLILLLFAGCETTQIAQKEQPIPIDGKESANGAQLCNNKH